MRSPINDEDIDIIIEEHVDTSYKSFSIALRGQPNKK